MVGRVSGLFRYGWERDFFFELPLGQANVLINGTNPFPESVKIGDYIREHSNPDDKIAVLGSEPQIYFYSKRLSATGYIYTYGLMERGRMPARCKRK